MAELERSTAVTKLERRAPRQATREELELFHTPRYVERVAALSARGSGLLDAGDTPAYPGVYEAAARVVGGTLEALAAIVAGPLKRAFIPIGGLHHATRDSAAGFCVFNDCGVAIEAARRVHGLRRVAYVDIDAHHGDGVFYAFEQDPDLLFADLHEDGRFSTPAQAAAAKRGAVPRPARSSTFRCRPAPMTRRSWRRGTRSSVISTRRDRSSSCCNAVPIRSAAIRSRTCS
jgi:acetoin utilization protein AcuC